MVFPILLFLACTGCGSVRIAETIRLRMAGAQIPVELVSSWLNEGDAFRFSITPVSPVYLSQNGFDALRRGDADVACTDRPITKRELADFGPSKPDGFRVAFYGFGLYVNLENPVDAIFAGHVTLLFQKRVTNWKQLGGKDAPIRLLGPPKSTRGGDILARQARIWFDDPTWEVVESPHEVIRLTAEDPTALGFAPIGFDGDVRYLGLRMERHGDAALPSLEEIEAARYGLAKIIYVYVNAPINAPAQSVLDYLFSDAGRKAIAKTDVWPIPLDRATVEAIE